MATFEGIIHDEGGAVYNVRHSMFGGVYAPDGTMTNAGAVFAAVWGAVPDGSTVLIPPGRYAFDPDIQQVVDKRLTVFAHGATLVDYRFATDRGIRWYGGTFEGTVVPDDSTPVLRLLHEKEETTSLQDLELEWSFLVGTGPYTGIEVHGGDVRMTNCTVRLGGRSAITFLGARRAHLKGLTLIGNPAGAPDDGLVLKATVGSCENVLVEDLVVESFGTGFATGTQAMAPFAVRGVMLKGLIARNVTYPVLLKVGYPGNDDDNLVEDVRIEGVVALDPEGAAMQTAVMAQVINNGTLRNVSVQGVSARGRAFSTATARAFVRVFAQGGRARVENLSVRGADFADAFGGLEKGPAAPGHPFVDAVSIEARDGALIRDVTLDGVTVDAIARGGVAVETSGGTLEGRIHVLNFEVRRPNASLSAPGVLSLAGWPAVIRNLSVRDPGALAPGVLPVTTTGAIHADSAQTVFGSVDAATNAQRVLWTAPCDCWLFAVRLTNDVPIAQSDADAAVFTLRKVISGGVETIATANTRVTGGIAVGPQSVSFAKGHFTAPGSVFRMGETLRLDKTHTGAGRATDGLKALLLFVPFHSPVYLP